MQAPDDEPPPAALDLDGFLLYQLAMLSKRLSTALERYYAARHGLNRAQWRMLALIGHCRRCAAADLVRRASLDAVAVHRAVQQLIDAGLVVRRRSADDGRVKLLNLSARGRRVHDDIVPVALALEARALAALPADEAASMRHALARLLALPSDAFGAGPVRPPVARERSRSQQAAGGAPGRDRKRSPRAGRRFAGAARAAGRRPT